MNAQLDWRTATAALSGVLIIVSLWPYIKDTVRGETRPNAISFLLWTTLGVIASVAQVNAGWSLSIVVAVMGTFNAAIVTVLSFAGYGYKTFGKTEKYSLVFAVCAIVGWQLTNDPVVAILFAVIADIWASFPTLVKTYHEPRTENTTAWALATTGFFFGAISTDRLDVANLAMPVYLTVMTGLIWALAYFGRRWKR